MKRITLLTSLILASFYGNAESIYYVSVNNLQDVRLESSSEPINDFEQVTEPYFTDSNGLEWLVLTETNGQSYNEIKIRLTEDLQNWRLATQSEVQNMLTTEVHSGLPVYTTGYSGSGGAIRSSCNGGHCVHGNSNTFRNSILP